MKNKIHFLVKTVLLLLLIAGGKVQGQTITGYTNVAGFSTIVSSTCTAASLACLGLPDTKVLVNNDNSYVHGRFAQGYLDGTGNDAYIFTYFHSTPYTIKLELNDGTFTNSVAINSTSMASASGTVAFYSCSSTNPTISTTSSYYGLIDFANFNIPTGKYVIGAYCNLGVAPASQASDIAKFVIVSNAIPKPCNAGITAPTLSATSKASVCPSYYVNLDALVTSTKPAGTSVVWYNNNSHTGTAVADGTQVDTAGTYYAFYYDATNDCYSPASVGVAVTINSCTINLANTCPANSIDLTTHAGAAPTGSVVSYHTGTPATDANKITAAAAAAISTSGTYYIAYYDSTQKCYSPTSWPFQVTYTSCCSAGSVKPNLTN